MKYIAQLGLILILLTIFTATVFADDKHGQSDRRASAGDNDKRKGVFEKDKHGGSEHRKLAKDKNNHDRIFADKNNGETNQLPNMFKSENEHGIDAT